MPLDVTARHVFAYGSSALQLADEHTLVAIAGNALQFSSTVTQSQHFLLRTKPRKLLAFDINWRNAEIAVTARDPDPEILVYSYPDKKLRGKLQHGAAFEYAQLKYSRCGRRLLTVCADNAANDASKMLCVWDMEKLEPLKGCANAAVELDVAFASFDPSDSDRFVLGGNGGLQLWKIYKGKASSMLRHVTIKITRWMTMPALQGSSSSHALAPGGSRAPSSRGNETLNPLEAAARVDEDADLDNQRKQLVSHAWMRHGRVLVANRAGELAILDTTATVTGSELTAVVLPGATRANRCCIAGIVCTSETIVLVYADGAVAWLGESNGELLQSTSLPGYSATSSDGSNPAALDANSANVITSVAPSPNYSKVYVGTNSGHIFELKVSVAFDEDEEMDEEIATSDEISTSHGRLSDDPSIVASRLISSCGSFHRGPVLASTALTPSGGTLANDLVVASGGSNGRVYLWSVSKCRSMGETHVATLFATGASALLTGSSGSSADIVMAAAPDISSAGGDSVGSPVPAASGASPDTPSGATVSKPPTLPGNRSDNNTALAITALAARPADPVLLMGDHNGKLRALCVAKVVGGNGALEFLPLHSIQLLAPGAAVDLLELHPTQPFVLASSTAHSLLFVLSLDHEKHFAVLAYVSLPSADERVVDVKWSVPPHSPAALSFTFLTTAGRLYLGRYQDTGVAAAAKGATMVLPVQLKPKVIAYGDESLTPMCTAIQFLSDAPVNVLLAVSPQSGDLLLLKYADLVIDPNERVPLRSKALAHDAHDPPGVAAIAVYDQRLRNGEQLIATAGVNGAVTVWMLSFSGSSALQTSELHLEDVHAAKKKTLQPHLGAVTSLSFVSVGADDDLYLVTTGVDGCVYLLDVRLSSDMVGLAKPEPIMSPLFLNVANFAKYEGPFRPEQDGQTRPLLSVVHEELETLARNRFDRLKDKTRAHLNDLEMKLKILLAENDQLPESERLLRDEFVVNTEWRDKLTRSNHARALAVRDGIQRDLAKMSIVRERMKREFWDSASIPGVTLRGLTPPSVVGAVRGGALFVYNFPMRKQTKAEALQMKRIELLRVVEYEHHKSEILALSAGSRGDAAFKTTRSRTPEPLATKETSLSRFHEAVSPNLQWLIDAGLHHSSLNRWVSDKLKQQQPTAFKDAKAGTADAVLVAADGASPHVSPGAPASLNETKSFHLVYHPAAVRTRKQQRTQILLLKSFVRFQLVEFNREFNELAKLKEAKIEEIDAKNARIQEIAGELGSATAASDLFRPKWAPDEIAASILEVAPEEMTQTPYESEEARRAREREAAEKAELERQRQKDDVAGRALKDMMDGTLEVKKENLVNQTLVKEPWMLDTPVDEMTAEQKKLLAQFEAAQQKLKEEQDKYKKSLDLELKKSKAEIQDICKAFDDRVRALQDVALALKTSTLVQQLYELRLAEDLMEHEHLVAETAKMEQTMAALQQEIRVSGKENELFAVQVEACKDEWHRATEEDKLSEKAFLRELEEALATQGIAIEHELVKHLMELYKYRKADDVRIGAVGSSSVTGPSGPKRGKSNMHLGVSKHRLLAEAGEQSSRTLAAATLLQNLQSSSSSLANTSDGLGGEHNFDPFVGVEMPGKSSATTAAGLVRHVVPLDYEVDRPDGLLIDDRTWRALNELRTKKILLEQTVRDKAEQFALAKAVAEELRVQLQERQDDLEDERSALQHMTQQLRELADNAPLLVHIKQGQDETGGSGDDIFRQAMVPATGDQEALLVARASVESLNDVIHLHGKDQVGILGKIKNFRKNINVMEWEHTLLDMQTRDMEERYTDIQLLRVTKDLQELFQTGDTSEKQKREFALLEAKMDHLGRHHQSHLLKLDAARGKLDKQLHERARENQTFAAQVAQLEMQVQIREDILLSRKSAALRNASSPSGSASSETVASGRLKAITVRRKLVDLARAQTEEIEFLRMELDKMRQRTFPTFAQHHATATHGGGGVDSLY